MSSAEASSIAAAERIRVYATLWLARDEATIAAELTPVFDDDVERLAAIAGRMISNVLRSILDDDAPIYWEAFVASGMMGLDAIGEAAAP